MITALSSLLPRAGPGAAHRRARRRRSPLPGAAPRDARPLVVDGRARVRADPRRVRRGSTRAAGRSVWSIAALALAGYLILPAVVGGGDHARPGQHFPCATRARLAGARRGSSASRRLVAADPAAPARAARAARKGSATSSSSWPLLRTPSSPWLPSEWAADAMMAALGGPAAISSRSSSGRARPPRPSCSARGCTSGWYRDGFSRAQEGARAEWPRRGRAGACCDRLLQPARRRSGALVAKEVRVFFRDTTQWSQLILLARASRRLRLQRQGSAALDGEEVGFFLVNVVSFLNLGLAGFVLAAIAARFIFPAVSLEGRTFWLLRSSPLELRHCSGQVLDRRASRSSAGVGPDGRDERILEVGTFMMVLSLGTIARHDLRDGVVGDRVRRALPSFRYDECGGDLDRVRRTALHDDCGRVPRPRDRDRGVAGLRRPRGALPWGGAGGEPAFGLWLGLAAALALSAVVTVVPLRAAVRRVGELEG